MNRQKEKSEMATAFGLGKETSKASTTSQTSLYFIGPKRCGNVNTPLTKKRTSLNFKKRESLRLKDTFGNGKVILHRV